MANMPYGSHGHTGYSDFGPPAPHYLGADSQHSRNATASTLSLNQSQYGSTTALRPYEQDSSASYPPESHRYYMDGTPRPLSTELKSKERYYEAPKEKSKRKCTWILLGLAAFLVVAAGVAVPLYFFVIKPKLSRSSSGTGSSNSTNTSHGNVLLTGADGSIVTKDDGTTFTYNNSFGGYWVFDPSNPTNNSARAQSWVPPLSEPWNFGQDKIFGVNLGGWLTLEPFISPALYQPFYPNAVDEWTLSTLLQAQDGNLNAIENHYKTFITEEDFAQIAAAGLSWVRIPLPYWAVETYPGEPFLKGTSWTYFLKAIQWARKYGIRINVDLHAVPGSQNGWNHSGRESAGKWNFLKGVMGVANAQRTLDYVRIIAEFISQPEYKDVVPYMGVINEPRAGSDDGAIPPAAMKSFYAEAYRIIRKAGGTGAGNGPFMSIHDSFMGNDEWKTFLPGADRLALDNHPYMIFGDVQAGQPSEYVQAPCQRWAKMIGDSMNTFGLTAAGEWSHAFNDCGLYFNSVTRGTRLEGTYDPAAPTAKLGDCGPWNDHTTYTDATKEALKQISAASIDALGNWFFWTWKIGQSTAGKIESPFWSYQLALQEGWALKDPRDAAGTCARLGNDINTYQGSLQSWQTGGSGAGNTPALGTYVWPPAAVGGFPDASLLPTYTATGALSTLAVPTFTQSSGAAATPDVGTGWTNPSDQTLMAVPVNGCTYPDPWAANDLPVPTACLAGAKRAEPTPML